MKGRLIRAAFLIVVAPVALILFAVILAATCAEWLRMRWAAR